MIGFLVKAASALSALVQLVKAVVVVAQECKKAYLEIKAAITKKEEAVVVQVVTKTEEVKVEAANAKSEAAKVFDINQYPEVDLSVFEGSNFFWGPSLETAYD